MGLSASAPWLAYYGNTPASLEYPHTTVYQQLTLSARRNPDTPAYVFFGKKTTYAAFINSSCGHGAPEFMRMNAR